MTEPTPVYLRSRYRARLEAELSELRDASRATTDQRRPVELDQQAVGRLSRMDAMQQQAMASAQESRRHGRVKALEAALRRLDGDDFGWCDGCGDFIGEPRLDLDPAIMRCRDCAG